MVTFFKRRPGTCVLAALVTFSVGGLLARHRSDAAQLPSATLARAKKKPAKQRVDDWRDRLSLSAAQSHGGQLVQSLSDGRQVTYTLDPELQQWALGFLQQYEVPYGAMVMYELDSGRTLVLAGRAKDDPKMTSEELCLTPWAPAASVFKLITTSALLDEGVPSNTQVCYHGGLHGLSARHLKDNPRLDSTCRTLSYAVAKSVNPIIGKLALRYLSSRSLARWAERYGFNSRIPFELPVRPSKAEIPSSRLGLAQVAAGFWHTEISPLHGAVIASVAASGGRLRWPQVVQQVTHPDGRVERPERPESRRVMSRRAARDLKSAMALTTTIGTARRAFRSRRGRPMLPQLTVAGKTGSLARKNPFLHYNWFAGFAPVDKPKVAFAVLLGNPPRWRIKAHTAARMLLTQYVRQQKKAPNKRPAVAQATGRRTTVLASR